MSFPPGAQMSPRVVVALILALGSACLHAATWVVVYKGTPTNAGTGTTYQTTRELDLSTIVRSGKYLRYKARTVGSLYGNTSEELAADCAESKRGHWTDLRLYSVYADTLAGNEVRAACQYAEKTGLLTAEEAGPHSVVNAPQLPTVSATEAAATPPANGKSEVIASGSAFAVGASRAVTNHHVIKGCRRVSVEQDGKSFQATVVATSEATDLALLQIESLLLRSPPIRQTAMLGEEVTAAGHPLSGLLSSDIVVTFGQVNSLAGLRNDPTHLQISAPVHPGNSGGPLIDRSGAIVGVVVSKLNVLRLARLTGDVAQNINFAIKPEILRLFLDANRVTYQSANFGARVDGVDIAQRARAFTLQVSCEN